MDIGLRLKLARSKAGFTQQQAAKKLNISRQTISNWENNKTYPELSLVIEMSEMYDLSLDELLRENTDYVNYIKSSTEKRKYKFRPSILIEIILFFVIWGIILATYYINPPADRDMQAYAIHVYTMVFPPYIFLFSTIVGIDRHWGRFKWVLLPAFAYSVCFMDYCTFNTSSLFTGGDVFLGLSFEFLPFFMISFIGILTGIILRGVYKNLKAGRKNGTARKA